MGTCKEQKVHDLNLTIKVKLAVHSYSVNGFKFLPLSNSKVLANEPTKSCSFIQNLSWFGSNACSSASSVQENRSRKLSSRFNARLLSMTSIRGISIKGFRLGKLKVFANAFHRVLHLCLETNAEGNIALSTKTCQAARLYIEPCNTEISQNSIVLHCYDTRRALEPPGGHVQTLQG